MNLVFVHGILDNGSIFNKMIAFFERHGIHCYAPSLKPSDGRSGLDDLANQLKSYIERGFTPENRISILGFSMGAMIARYYLQQLGGANVTQKFFSVSGPHNGSMWAYLYPGKGAKQMRPGSEFLRDLNHSVNCLKDMDIYSYWTPFDLVIVPPSSSQWAIAHNIKINALCHACMLSDSRLLADINDKLTQTNK